jgi:hypothetical protein
MIQRAHAGTADIEGAPLRGSINAAAPRQLRLGSAQYTVTFREASVCLVDATNIDWKKQQSAPQVDRLWAHTSLVRIDQSTMEPL